MTMRHTTGPTLLRRCLSAAALALPLACAAQAWPNKPVKVVVSSFSGSPADVVIRALSDEIALRIGQPLIVENKGGAQGAIGLGAVAKAEPDGYTFGVVNLQSVAAAILRKDMPYNMRTSFAPVAQLTYESPVLISGPRLPADNLADLARQLKAKSGQVSYASAGSGSPSHLGMELFAREIGAKLQHVPYKGAVPAATDVAGGQAELTLVGSSAATPLIKSGRVKAMAVASEHRLASLPDVPTFAEAGFPNVDVRGWVGLVAPAQTSPEILAKMQQAVTQALGMKVVKDRLATLGSSAAPSTSAAFGAMIVREDERWAKVVRDANIGTE
ncbi:MAG: tripartite tricarboxylate transporter substrate binding protein [Pseudomonadota bacterium]